MVNIRRLAGMETDEERTTRIVIRVVVMLLVSMYLAADEVRYSVWGQTGEARMITEKSYRFIDDEGTEYTGSIRSPDDVISNGRVLVSYIPGASHKSRLVGSGSWWPFAVLAVALVVCAWMLYPIWKEASDYANGKKPRRR